MPSDEKKLSYVGIRDIARLAGVSTATVSRVINHPEQTSPQILERVRQIIEEQHYIPNQTIKGLFSHSSNSLALFIYDMSNPFFISLIQELNKIAFDNKHTLLICDTSNDAKKEQEYLDYCTAVRVSSIILTEGFDFIANSSDVKQSLIMFDRSGMRTYPSVHSNNIESVEQAVYFLHNLHHRRIAFVAPDKRLLSIQERERGYERALERRNIPLRPEYIFAHPLSLNVETGIQAMNYFYSLPEPPTAIICANDMLAQGVLLRAQALRMEVPRDLSVIGFDGVTSSLMLRQLTTIRQNVPAIAKKLFELSLHAPEVANEYIIPTEFIYGETCGYCPQ